MQYNWKLFRQVIPGRTRATVKEQLGRLVCVLASLFCVPSLAASLQVSPISVEMQAHEPVQSVWLSNTGDQPIQAQVRVYAWTQDSGEDVLKPTQDLVVSPPMVTIPPGQRQLVRLVRVGAGKMPPSTEKTFRVVMDELPVALGAEQEGVKFVLRYSVPVFIAPAGQGAQAATVKWELRQDVQGDVLVARNHGGTRAKVTAASVVAPDGSKVVLTEGLYGYVLAGSDRHWNLSREAAAILRKGELTMSVNDEAESVRIGTTR